MNGYIKRSIDSLTSKPKIVFLIDGIGAVLTAVLLMAVVKTHDEYFRMPQEILTILAILALIFAIYSFSCFAFSDNNWQKLLKPIIVANLTYCILILGLLIYFYNKLTILDIIYFLGEVLIICGLAYIELKTLKASRKK